MRPIHENEVVELRNLLNAHGDVMAKHLECLPVEEQDIVRRPYLQTFAAMNSLLNQSLLQEGLTLDLSPGTPASLNDKRMEHVAEHLLSKALGEQFQFFKNPLYKIPAESRVALLKSLENLMMELDDLGVFVTQGAGTWSKATLPEDVGKKAKTVREGDVVSRKDAKRAEEGLQPSPYGLFKSVRVEIEKLNNNLRR